MAVFALSFSAQAQDTTAEYATALISEIDAVSLAYSEDNLPSGLDQKRIKLEQQLDSMAKVTAASHPDLSNQLVRKASGSRIAARMRKRLDEEKQAIMDEARHYEHRARKERSDAFYRIASGLLFALAAFIASRVYRARKRKQEN